MLDIAEARAMVADVLDQHSDTPCMVVDDLTQTHEFGWVFYYQSQEFIKTGEFRDQLLGNAPLIVNRFSGRLLFTGTAQGTGSYIEAYLACGDPHARPTNMIRILGWRCGARKVAGIRLVKAITGKTLGAARAVISSVIDNNIEVLVHDNFDVPIKDAVASFNQLGFDCEQVWE